jgi:hypothetical protein
VLLSDIGAVLLIDPVADIAPLPVRAPAALDAIPDLVGTRAVSVGYDAAQACRECSAEESLGLCD